MTSENFRGVDLPNQSQMIILAVLLFFIPPLPIFLLTAPKYTILTKEFLVSVLLTLFGHVPGVLFSLYYVLIEFPRINADAYERAEGYIRLGDDEESQLVSNEEERPDPSRLGISQVQPPSNLDSHSNAGNTGEPPRYEDIVAPHEQQHPGDTKNGGDNKVQH
ncbi:hypothetical protein HYPBUDRAFT_152408 [Hyphopichia burtonii NRRL Y-1933]|uniref:Uncharacterized protein n=1 Tax=Hyphopichia burtonii NRRL Y-1933 TaxID=984485 RepID=A0A1E4RJP1_9ASCO|nr:hypothetical protein HYPBUDRAFT_152408 [Hyphopichia burtonii NRRL Y-1933]ODV67489.1 hypothetical protein HYPBUDRAFT_152408 [Hyphopichia burtonii NRRL Y-1933]